jgi:MutS domain V/MutS domain III
MLAQEKAAALDKRSARIANLRTIVFLGGFALLMLVTFATLPRAALWGVVFSAAIFVALVVWHSRVIHDETLARTFVMLNQRGIARIEGGWHQFDSRGIAHATPEHLFAFDLDVVGQGSLFQRIDETGTALGERQLAQWLLFPVHDIAQLVARQQAVKTLTPAIDFRQQLVAEAKLAKKAKADPSRFIAWAEADSFLGRVALSFPVAHLMVPLTVTLGLLSAFDVVPSSFFAIPFFLQIGLVLLTRNAMARFYQALLLGDEGLIHFEDTFSALDAARFEDPTLQLLQRGLATDGPSVSQRLKSLTFLLNIAALRQSAQLHPFVNALLLWDIHVLFRIERWRKKEGARVRQWFEALAQFEALSALATFAFEQPEATFPQLSLDAPRFEARALTHPLLEGAVANDVILNRAGATLIITGSNMSGKTTLMRTIGLNTVMALAGMPVCAKSMTLSPLAVVTCMRLKDSLERGVSYFYAEVQRTQALLQHAVSHPGSTLFLIDEMFMGTNTRERQLASKHVLRRLIDSGAIGALTTHDLALCDLANERPGVVSNVHFRDSIINGEMTFDYQLHEGIVQTTNALEVLRRAGIDVPSNS